MVPVISPRQLAIDIENGRGRAAIQPGTKLITIEGAGHLPHQERPEAFLKALALAP